MTTCPNYMWTPPTHHYLESSGRASYMKTHPSSFSFLFFLRHRADMPPSKNMMQLTTWQVSCQVESRCHSRNLFLEIWVSLSPSLSPLNIYSVLSLSLPPSLSLLNIYSVLSLSPTELSSSSNISLSQAPSLSFSRWYPSSRKTNLLDRHSISFCGHVEQQYLNKWWQVWGEL